jgi:hypothetical protein
VIFCCRYCFLPHIAVHLASQDKATVASFLGAKTGDLLRKDTPVAQTLTAPRKPFTWQLPEHRECEHAAGPVVAIKANAQKLAFCVDCNLLFKLKPGTAKKPSPHAASDGTNELV